MTAEDGVPGPGRVGRRRVLSAAGSAVAAGIAGCVSEETVEGDVVDDPRVFALPFPHVPENVGLNPWGSNFLWDFETLFFETPSLRTPAGEVQRTDLIEDVETDGETATVTYADGYTWWNGEPVTARDRWVDERIQSYVRDADVQQGEEVHVSEQQGTILGETDDSRVGRGGVDLAAVELLDDNTIRYEFDVPLDEPLAVDRAIGRAHKVGAWRFEQWLERLEDASTTSDVEDAILGLRGDRIGLEDALDEGYGCGPYELAEVSVNRLVLDPHGDHPGADDLSVPRLWLPVGMEQQTTRLVSDGVVDGGRGTLEDWTVEPADSLSQLAHYPSGAGQKLLCNWHNPHLARASVRRAIAAVLPLDQIAERVGWGVPARVQCGMTEPSRDRWLDDDLLEALHRYPVERDDDRAGTFMRRGGYERRDDRWRGPDGEAVSLALVAPLWAEWSEATDVVDAVLREFGFDVEYLRRGGSTFVADVQSGTFDLAPWVAVGRPHWAYDLPARDASTLGYGVDGGEESTPQGKPTEGVAPPEPGELGADEDGDPVDLLAAWRRIRRPGSASETAEAVATVATWWNVAVPDVDLTSTRTGVWGNVAEFDWPEAGDDRYRLAGPAGRPDVQLLRSGAVVPTTDGDD